MSFEFTPPNWPYGYTPSDAEWQAAWAGVLRNITGASVAGDIAVFLDTSGQSIGAASFSISGIVVSLTTIAALRNLTAGLFNPTQVYVSGYASLGDGGEGIFVYNPTDTTSADNGGTIIVDLAGRRWYRNMSDQRVSVKWFGATGNGTTNDTAAIQATINAVGALGGGVVWFPKGTYKISSTLTVGNGSAGVISTVYGVVLRGDGQPIFPAQFFGGYSGSTVSVVWAGGAAPMISINGPLQGWGVQNLYLDGGIVATVGIQVISASFGDNENLCITDCTVHAISSTTVNLFTGAPNTDSFQNTWKKLNIWIPAVVNANGILLTGYPNVESDTDLNWFESVFISLPSTGVAAVGLRLQSCDTNTFRSMVFTGGTSATTSIVFDYGASPGAVWPSGNAFFQLDASGSPGNNQYSNAGTPAPTTGPNYVYGINDGSGALNPVLANFTPSLPSVYPGSTISQAALTASIASSTLFVPFEAGLFRVHYYLAIDAVGNNVTIGFALGWNDGSQVRSETPAGLAANALGFQTGSFLFYAVASVPVIYAATLSGAIGAGFYQLRVTVERLG